jgi:hypothetical protein
MSTGMAYLLQSVKIRIMIGIPLETEINHCCSTIENPNMMDKNTAIKVNN